MTALVRLPASAAELGARVPIRVVAIVAATVLAYHYSLSSLTRGFSLQTPLGYLALVPVIALGLAWVERRTREMPAPPELALDFVLGRAFGAALVVVALVIALLVPTGVSFWLQRVDLLSVPLFVAGATALMYGVRVAWRMKVPITFLFLMWPIPWVAMLGDAMRAFTDLAVGALTALSVVIPIASPVGTEGLFRVLHADGSFLLSVGAACAGVNGLVGFLLIGGGLSTVVTGPVRRRLAWLATGLLLIWMLNLARIELIFVAGALFGERAAYDVLHPVAGLIVFNVGVGGMLLLVSRMGLQFRPLVQDRPLARVGSPRRSLAPFVVLVPAVLLMGVLNAGFARYEGIAGGLGQPRLATFDRSESQVAGWSSALLANYAQAQQFFGQDASWHRLIYQSGPGASMESSVPVYVDVVDTAEPAALAAYGIEECYQFHGYVVESKNTVLLGGGVTAEVIDYHNPKLNSDWSALWWEWPYQTSQGDVRYERVVVIIENGPLAIFEGGVRAPPTASPRFADTDRFLLALSRQLALKQLAAAQS